MAADLMILPDEIIEYILEDKDITLSDTVKFGQTCKQIYRIIKSSGKIWKTKFFQRWPLLKEVYEENIKCEEDSSFWLQEIQVNIQYRRELLHQLSLMSNKNYQKPEPCNSDLKIFDPLFRPEEGAHPLAYHFIIDELVALLDHPIRTDNLTQKHYALRLIRYIKQSYLKPEWQKFISLPSERQTLERAAILVAQWMQPERHISYKNISSLLDDIAEQTRQFLKQENPMHGIFSMSIDQVEIWKDVNLLENQWEPTEARQVMDALCYILFGELGFHGSNVMYYASENSFIDHVLEYKRGTPITLAVVFESIARRLGIRCEAVCFPSHFLLRWKEKYNVPEAEELESFYIDVINGGRLLTKNNCPRVARELKCPIQIYNVHNTASTIEVMERMVANLAVAIRQQTHLNDGLRGRYALELKHMISPRDRETIMMLGRFYIRNGLDIGDLVRVLEDMQLDVDERFAGNEMILDGFRILKSSVKPEKDVRPKKRKPGLKYAVGLIMRHNTQGYLCVITGWYFPHTPLANLTLDNLIIDCQPVYNVLGDDGSSEHIDQDSLSPARVPKWINHREIGRYFCKFATTHYIPNEETAREYPEDADSRNTLLSMLTFF